MTHRTSSTQVIWITGASSGIGEALAHQFASIPNTCIILSARRIDELNRVKHSLATDPSKVVVLPFDVTDYSSHQRIVQEAFAAFGQLDVVIHNAGVSQRSYILDTTFATYQRLMDVDYFGPVSLTQHILPKMIAAGGGRFVVISSVAGKVGTIMRSGYCGAKFGVIGFIDALRAEHTKDNIKVTTICPGFINTQVAVNALAGDGQPANRLEKNIHKGIAPEQCAKIIVKSINKDKKEVIVAGIKEHAAAYLRRFAPNLLFKVMTRSTPE